MSAKKNTPYLHLLPEAPEPRQDAMLALRITADVSLDAGQGSVAATLEQYDGQPSYFLELDGDGVGDDGEVASLGAVEALGRALIAAARKARAARSTPRRPRAQPPRLMS